MQVGDYGENVRRLQLALLERDHKALPRYGADGDFGRETQAAVLRYAMAGGYRWDPREPVPEPLLDSLGCGEIPDDVDDDDVPAPRLAVPLFDLRHEAKNPHPKSKIRNGKTVVRAVASIDSIVLHQTAVGFAQPKGTTGDLALARRALKVACHAMAFRRGFVALAAPLRWYIYHADSCNARSLGLEVDGNYPGRQGVDVATGTETPLTDATIEAAREGMRLLVEQAAALKINIRYAYAHRQFDSWRRADPGQGLWKAVVLEYAVPKLGLEVRHAETLPHPKYGEARRGLPVPIDWDPAGKGKY